MPEQRQPTSDQPQRLTTTIDFESSVLQMDDYDHQLKSWQRDFERKENVYDEYINKQELKFKALEIEIRDLQHNINRLLGDFEGISNTERTNSMEAKKSQLLEVRQAMEQEISIPIDEFAGMEVAREDTVLDSSSEIKDVLSIAFYQNLGIKAHSNTKNSEHVLELVSYHKPTVDSFTFNEGSDVFANAQKIWDSISP